MEIFGIEKLSLVDYDGKVACTLFTASCNFRCGFCHNSPLVTDVRSLTPIPEEQIFAYLNQRKNVLDGVCISGGEPTLNCDLPKLCERIKELGLSVKLDTNGTNPDMIQSLVSGGLCDYVAMDIKNSLKNYAKIIGFDSYDTSKVERSVEYLLTKPIDFEFRTTLISQYHTAKDIQDIAGWIQGAPNYAMQKFKDTGGCISQGLSEVPYEVATHYLQIAQNYIPSAKLRGY